MTTPAIEVSHLTKAYRLGALHSLKDTALNAGRRLLGRPVAERALFKALDDVSFCIEPGEVVGIIGHNGAGKSTLLKMLARISTPTSGTVKVNGRIAPLIEVGAGFVPDFTGRENVYLNGAILGMSKAEIDRKFDEIVDFAEMAEFIDTPVKRYSSGMQVKLAFAVATSVESEILIVDEVLAVGDLAFQRKCFDRMGEAIRRQDRTVLIVSHNIRQIERMCSRVMLMDHGQLVREGQAIEVCDAFFRGSNDKIAGYAAKASHARIRTSGEVELIDIAVVSDAGEPIDEIAAGSDLTVRVRFRLAQMLERPEIIVGTHTTDFVYLTGASTALLDGRPDYDAGEHEIAATFKRYPLAAGVYSVRFVILDAHRRTVFVGENLSTFKVRVSATEAREEGLRILDVPVTWRLPVNAGASNPVERHVTVPISSQAHVD
ncbi:MAG: ABC transporter ATP-binding protein [Burkholderiaceae bacterium]|jgi:ABC-type polysaccharide/polyol phosphate transport system ATPase subunit|nr:ABC transporter ATP-binding protein [Burkholderiaceae bacterium]MCU0963705.1 ABC transporter ATP-binding protein [Burkholderiaceae bacterium]